MDTSSIDEKFSYFIPDDMTSIFNQKSLDISFPLAIADMMTMIRRIALKDPHTFISPQPLIDATADPTLKRSFDYFRHLCTTLGVESVSTFPFRIISDSWDENVYKNRGHARFKLDNLTYFDDQEEIKKQIVENFGPRGQKFPIVGVLYMDTFADRAFAHTCEEERKPYRLNEARRREIREKEHALLITGCDTTSTDSTEHYCRVKNTDGWKWGNNAFSLVSFDTLKYIMVPVYDEGNTQIPPV